MTIVATNNITVSNVNDGTITHTAYAYSADGSDRFTTVYPNLNLLKNTKSQSYISTGTAENTSSFIYPLDGVVADILNKPLTITYNYEITNSLDTWSGTIRPTYGLGGINQSVSDTNLRGTHKETITLSGIGFNSYRIVTSGLPAGTTVTITNLKVEFGSTTTPWMPSSSEATTADYPSYIGTYSDTNVDGSTNPSKYTWAVFKGADGIAGQPGANAPTITNVQDQIYLSTSNTAQSGGSWGILIPAWSSGKYYWSRVATTFSNGTTTYSTPVLDEALNQAATNQVKVTQLTQDLDGFKTTVSNTYLSKSDASGTYADKNSVTSQINQSATAITSNVQTWTNDKLTSYSTTQQTTDSITSAVANKADKSQITQLSDNINLKVSKGDVISSINQEAGQIVFNANKLVLNANTTEITGDAFIRGDMIVDGSIKVEKLEVNNLSALTPNLGTITGGSYESWGVSISQTSGNVIYTGIYMYLGETRSLTIIYNDSTTPNKNIYQGGRYSGVQLGSSGVTYFALDSINMGPLTPHELLIDNTPYGFWSRMTLSNKNSYIGKIGSGSIDGEKFNILVDSQSGGMELLGDFKTSGSLASKIVKKVIPFGWSRNVILRRSGNLVTLEYTRQAGTHPTGGENVKLIEKIPEGYRPIGGHSFTVNRNNSTTFFQPLVYNIEADGSIYATITQTGTTVLQGSTSWYTTDSFPTTSD